MTIWKTKMTPKQQLLLLASQDLANLINESEDLMERSKISLAWTATQSSCHRTRGTPKKDPKCQFWQYPASYTVEDLWLAQILACLSCINTYHHQPQHLNSSDHSL